MMDVLCWMMLVFSLSAGTSSAVILQDVQTITQDMRTNFFIRNHQFSMAMNVPTDPTLRATAFTADLSTTVSAQVTNGGVYKGTNVVEAIPLKTTNPRTGKQYTEHAEARVLDNIEGLASRTTNNILMFYTFLSPCGSKCLSEKPEHTTVNIINKIQAQFPKWGDKAFVFTKVFDGYGTTRLTDQEISETLFTLGAAVGYHNLFRCFLPLNRVARCVACFSANTAGQQQLSNQCISN